VRHENSHHWPPFRSAGSTGTVWSARAWHAPGGVGNRISARRRILQFPGLPILPSIVTCGCLVLAGVTLLAEGGGGPPAAPNAVVGPLLS